MEASLFLPLNKKEARAKGWDEVDFVLISGDAYVDHPSFGTALIGRLLENDPRGSMRSNRFSSIAAVLRGSSGRCRGRWPNDA